MKKILIASFSFAVFIAMGWLLWPTVVVESIGFVEPKGEEPSRQACDRIVAIGPRAIPAIIHSLKHNSPWRRRYCYLPIALRELGEPAHDALIQAIDTESDSQNRAKLVSSLQCGFGDYSRLSVVIDDAMAGLVCGYPLHMMSTDIEAEFTNAPVFQTEDPVNGTVNPAFVKWWKENDER